MKKLVEQAIKVIEIEKACVERAVKNCNRDCGNCDLVMSDKDIIESYNMAISALEKQIQKKMIKYDKYYYKCPVCGTGTGVSEEDMTIYEMPQPHYCSNCGQALRLER